LKEIAMMHPYFPAEVARAPFTNCWLSAVFSSVQNHIHDNNDHKPKTIANTSATLMARACGLLI
jgi:hypothetical protein